MKENSNSTDTNVGSMENSIEETIKQLKLILKVRKEQKEIIECAGGSCMNCDPDIKALYKSIYFLSDYKRVLKENEELLECASAHNRILKLEKENKELKTRLDEIGKINFPIIN